MIEQDTIKLLRECDAGTKMGIESIEDVLGHVERKNLYHKLENSKQEHEALHAEIQQHLWRFHDQGKNPSPIAKGMSKVKTTMKLSMENTDQCIAGLMADGCNMGVKSLNHYLNQYKAADEKSKDMAKRLIHLEETLAREMQAYL